MNPMMQFMQMIRQGGNPQMMLIQMLQGQAGRNPIAANLLSLARNQDTKGLEEIARNMAKEKGIDFDTEFSKFRNFYHL